MVSNKKYKEVLQKMESYRKYFFQNESEKNKLRLEIASLKEEIKKCCNTNRELVNMVDEYRRKYLDEQHKRLELAEFVKRLEGENIESERLPESVEETR
jgi:vacuolar-type H+-ATPase subunit I/STV1